MAMKPINPGIMKERITILKFGDYTDDMGQTVEKLVPLATVWGDLYPTRGRESYELRKIESRVTHKCYIRYLEGVDSNCFLRCRGKTYAIESAIDMGMERRLLEIFCYEGINSEVVPDGGSSS